ncbi:hypothetical protein SO802_010866 [Lithocarpus litseifolius]|uniref:Uncharacterized protein n=1 Tax=Lithocarpus litseifolius TaxID=425828 RepID=A0AAW2DGV7_9ROSI
MVSRSREGGPLEDLVKIFMINLLAARNERGSVQVALRPKVSWVGSGVAGVVQVQLVVGQSVRLRHVVPILGVPDALVPLDLPVDLHHNTWAKLMIASTSCLFVSTVNGTCLKNKENRDKNNTIHTSGSKSFQQRSAEEYQEAHKAKFPWDASLQYFQKAVDALKAIPPTHESDLCLRNQHKSVKNGRRWLCNNKVLNPTYLSTIKRKY